MYDIQCTTYNVLHKVYVYNVYIVQETRVQCTMYMCVINRRAVIVLLQNYAASIYK